MIRMYAVALALILAPHAVFAHAGHGDEPADLKSAPSSHQVLSMTYCKGEYHLRFKDGSAFTYPEFKLRIKTDSSPEGPAAGVPVQLSAGMHGDRAFVVFSGPEEISAFIEQCPA